MAVGTIAPMIIQPWGAVLIGFVSGALSTSSFKYSQVLSIQFYLSDMVPNELIVRNEIIYFSLHLDAVQMYTFASIFVQFVF